MSVENSIDTQDSQLSSSDVESVEVEQENIDETVDRSEDTTPEEILYFWSEPGVCG